MPSEVKNILDSTVKPANFTEAMPMNAKSFLCTVQKNMGIFHLQVLLRKEVR
jgi:hypothetical protein